MNQLLLKLDMDREEELNFFFLLFFLKFEEVSIDHLSTD